LSFRRDHHLFRRRRRGGGTGNDEETKEKTGYGKSEYSPHNLPSFQKKTQTERRP
jgi:hypothetical protein